MGEYLLLFLKRNGQLDVEISGTAVFVKELKITID